MIVIRRRTPYTRRHGGTRDDLASLIASRIGPRVSLIGGIALASVAVQLLATLLFQFAPFKSRLYRLDFIGVLPRWRFFVPDGGGYDHALGVRGRRGDGTPGAWRTLWEMPVRRPWSWLWSPDPEGHHDLWYAVATLDRRTRAARAADATTSHAYATILAHCRRRLRDDAVFAEHQFAVVRIDRTGTRQFGYVSPFHARGAR